MVIDNLRVSKETATLVTAENLRRLISDIFHRLGVPEEEARMAADVLVLADLRGVDSHGVSNYVEAIYVPGLKGGIINPTPKVHIVRETPATALIDGDEGLGMVVGQKAMKVAIDKAKEVGAAFVSVRNSRHFGMAAYYSMIALPHDMIGISMTNATANVLPTFGRESRLGTNPISLAAPAGKEPPFILDMATSAVAVGKIIIANRLGVPIPEGWAADAEGSPTTDPEVARQARRFLPLGGTREQGSHKGYSLAVMVDILTAVLSGATISANLARDRSIGHFFAAIRIDAFRPKEEFKADIDAMLQGLKTTPPVEGEERVYYAGLIEHETLQERTANGIPLASQVADYLRSISKELGVGSSI